MVCVVLYHVVLMWVVTVVVVSVVSGSMGIRSLSDGISVRPNFLSLSLNGTIVVGMFVASACVVVVGMNSVVVNL